MGLVPSPTGCPLPSCDSLDGPPRGRHAYPVENFGRLVGCWRYPSSRRIAIDASVMHLTPAPFLMLVRLAPVLALAVAVLGHPASIGSLAAQTAKAPPVKQEKSAKHE